MKRIRKTLSFVLAVTVLLSTALVANFSVVQTVSAFADGEKTIDFTSDLNGSGFGCGSGGEHARLQTFTANTSGVLTNVKLMLNSNEQSANENMKLGDLVVGIYEMETAVTAGDALAVVTIPKNAVVRNTSVPMAVYFGNEGLALEAGTTYAIYVSQPSELWAHGNEHYRWPTGNVPAASGQKFIKYVDSNYIDESNLGTGWLQIYLGGSDTPDVDYSFPVEAPGSLVGFSDNVAYRGQLFTLDGDATLKSFDIWLPHYGGIPGTNERSDVDLALYLADGSGLPYGDPLKTVALSAAELTGAPQEVEFDIGLEAATYVLAVIPKTLALRYTDNAYTWPRASMAGAKCLYKYSDGDWAVQNDLAFWLRVNYISGMEEPTDTTVVDYGTFVPGSGGLGVGTNDEQYRWQSFTASATGTLSNVKVYVNKKVDSGPVLTDLIAEIYDTEYTPWGDQHWYLPTGTALGRVQVPVSSITFNGSTGGYVSVDFNVPVTEGTHYAVALTQETLTVNGSDGSGEHYRWPTGTVNEATASGETGGKKTSGGWVPEYGTYWMQATITHSGEPGPGEEETLIDFGTFVPGSGGLGVGTMDEMYRWQTFTANRSGAVEKITLNLNKRYEGQPYSTYLTDLIVEIYETADNGSGKYIPTGSPLKRIIVPKGLFEFTVPASGNDSVGREVTFNVNCPGIVEGTRYAVALSQVELALNGSAGEHYRWPFGTVAAAAGEFSGKKNSGGWVEETQYIGTGWMKIYLNDQVDPDLRPRTITLDRSGFTYIPVGGSLTVNAEVFDQNGDPMDDVALEWTSTRNSVATVSNGVIQGVSAGKASIQVKAGSIISSLSVQVYDSYPNKITGSPNLSLKAGESLVLDYDVMDDFKNIRPQDKAGITFALDGTAASIAGTTLTGVAPGSVQMEIRSGNLVKYANVNVYEDGESLVEPTPGMVITSDVKFKPGIYNIGTDGLRIGASGITVDGNGAILVGGTDGSGGTESSFGGTGLYSEGYDNITVKNLTLTNFNTGIYVNKGDSWLIENCDLSDNFNDPSIGWIVEDISLGATRLVNLTNSVIRYNNGNNVWNGINLLYGEKNKIYNNDFGICGNVSLKLWGSSYNEIYDNIFNWGLRMDPGETHARDSTSSLFEYNSNFNYIARNDFSHGGDGIFIRPLYGAPPMGNYFEGNETSWANNNAVESWAPGNVYVGNIANYSSYGFWLGGSDFTYLIDNEVRYNGGYASGATNAPEPFGNAGVSVVNGASSHFVMAGNDVEYNNGPALAIKFNNSQNPAYHWIVQNNLLSNNPNDPRGYKGYGVYTQHAQWVDILSNRITNNGDAALKEDGNTRNISLIGPNTAVSSLGAPVADMTASPAIMSQYADAHRDKIPQQIKDAQYGIVRIQYVSVKAGEEITFDASGSTDPQDLPLTYRWELGDGTVEAGATVTHTYTTPGVYRAGLTVKNSELGDVLGFIVTVVPDGQELDGDAGASAWALSASNAALDTYTTHRVAGSKAVKVSAASGQDYRLTYPATKDLSVNFGEYSALSLFVEVNIERGLNANYMRPVIKLCKDGSNYFQYTPKLPFMDPINLPVSEPRYSYQYLMLNLAGENDQFSRTMQGSLTLADINYIEITAGPAGNGQSTFAVDGLMLVGESAGEGTGVSPVISRPGTQAAPTGIGENLQTGSSLTAPLSNNTTGTPGSLAGATSEPDTAAWYGVDFGEARYVDTLEVYYLYEPNEQGDQQIVRPISHTVQYWDGNEWKAVSGAVKRPVTPAANLNTIAFDMVKTSRLRIVPTVPAGKAFKLYAFKAFNTGNLIGNSQGNLYQARGASSSGSVSPDLLSVTICVSEKGESLTRDLPLNDLIVSLYAVDGNHTVGAPLATTTVPRAEVNLGGLTTVNLPYSGLVPGARYAIALSQVETSGNGDKRNHYLWPTSSIPGITEYYGKMTNMQSGASYHEALGTGWLIVTTDAGVIDLSPGAPRSGGFGVGHQDEVGRYQTFTVPMDDVYATVDGNIDPENGWSSEGFEGDTHWLEFETEEASAVDTAILYFAGPPAELPQTVTAEAFAEGEWVELDVLSGGEIATLTEITFDRLVTSKVRFTFTQAEGSYIRVREAELLAARDETPPLHYTITATAGPNGSIAPESITVEAGGEAVFTVTPNAGYEVDTVTGGTYNAGGSTITVSGVQADGTVAVTFKAVTASPPVGPGPQPTPTPAPAPVEGKLIITPVLNSGTGMATAELTPQNYSSALNTAITDENGVKTVVLEVSEVAGASGYAQQLPAEAVTSGKTDSRLEIRTGVAAVTVPGSMLANQNVAEGSTVGIGIAKADTSALDEATKQAIGDRPVIELNLSINGQPASWSNPDAPVTVAIPYTPTAAELADPEHIVVWYIDGSGNAVVIPDGRYDAATGTVVFTTDHFSTYAVLFVKKTFSDLENVLWAKKAVEVLASRGIINGTGKDTYTPEANITKADYTKLLIETLGLKAEFEDNFDDVPEGTHYYNAAGIARKLGIAQGIGNNRFDPGAYITRQEMAALTVRALQAARGLKLADTYAVLDSFTDKENISDYALQGMATMVQHGLIIGSGTRLDPKDNFTRAQAAVVMYRIYNMK